jgi:Kef-type K+ transport system membrane component KefB
MSSSDITLMLLGAAALLGAAHLSGELFVRARCPRVVGEIVAGLMLGPTLLGAASPMVERALFPSSGASAAVLGAVYQLGLVFLMFATGTTLGVIFRSGERRVAVTITVAGVLLPFLAGILILQLFDLSFLEGTAHNSRSLELVFAAGIAVTSIPVISRIMMDIGIMNTSFARIVLNAAVIEDVILYAILAVAVGLAQSATGGFGLAAVLGISSASVKGAAYYAITTLVVLAVALCIRPLLSGSRGVLERIGAPPVQLVGILVITAVCLMLGVTPVFGGFVAGIITSGLRGERATEARESITRFAFSFFIPIYFAIVGLRLDLLRRFDLVLFSGFLALACLVKSSSVYLGARIAGEAPRTAQNLAVAMNARGGPGIVLASVAYEAQIIDQEFYSYLVILAIVTSLFAGAWLGRVVRAGIPLRGTTLELQGAAAGAASATSRMRGGAT